MRTKYSNNINYSFLVAPQSAFWRYTAFQIPGWIIASMGGWWLHYSLNVPAWISASILVVWVVKDYVLYPVLRFAYEADSRRRIEHLIGSQGTAVESLEPNGYIRVHGELWQATSAGSDTAVIPGHNVTVIGTDGMVLIVRKQI
jgi:membrane-bound ClpP family serine protease